MATVEQQSRRHTLSARVRLHRLAHSSLHLSLWCFEAAALVASRAGLCVTLLELTGV